MPKINSGYVPLIGNSQKQHIAQRRPQYCKKCVIFTLILVIIIVITIIAVYATVKAGKIPLLYSSDKLKMLEEYPVRPTDKLLKIKLSQKISQYDLTEAYKFGLTKVKEKIKNEANSGEEPDEFPPSYFHKFLGSFNDNRSLEMWMQGLFREEAAIYLKDRFNLNREEILYGLPELNLLNLTAGELQGICPESEEDDGQNCNFERKYRNVDGSCNNLEKQTWGKAIHTYRRGLQAEYSNDINHPRKSLDGSDLVNPRFLSNEIHSPKTKNSDSSLSSLFVSFGQLVYHDISRTAINQRYNGLPLKCCKNDFMEPLEHEECLSFAPPENDNFHSNVHKRFCMDFTRSASGARANCKLGPREQFNLVTSFLDGSFIYGSREEETLKLRSFVHGKLKTVSFDNDFDLLPFGPRVKKFEDCEDPPSRITCMEAGDKRVNENVLLTAMQTIWLREHNRVCQELIEMHKKWEDDKLFEEARRIVIAELQHITFTEYLPIVLGDHLISEFIPPSIEYYYKGYDKNVEATIANEFAAAAFRFGHAQIPDVIKLKNDNGEENLQLYQAFYNPLFFNNSKAVDRLIQGAAYQSVPKIDRHFSEQVKNYLFANEDRGSGLDLVAITIQRGRDHGLVGYNQWRKFCGLKEFKTFADLEQVMDSDAARQYSKLFKNVDDIDLYSGGISEYKVPGGLVGPTFGCLIADQFARLRNGDRFWYENGPEVQPYFFTIEQLTEIRKVKLGRIVCDNTHHVDYLQPDLFRVPSERNKPVSCTSSDKFSRMEMSYWA